MIRSSVAAAADSIGSPLLWAVTVLTLVVLLGVDFAITRRPHAVRLREAVTWTVIYLALPVLFGVFVWAVYGTAPGVEFLTGYILEKSLSVDNLFIFMLLLAGFAVPAPLAQRVLLYGIIGALILRVVFIALGTAALRTGTWAFLVFGAVLLLTAAKVLTDALRGRRHQVDVDRLRSVRLVRRLMPVTAGYRKAKMTVREGGRRALTPMALVVVAVFMTDIVFAVDSVPAVYGVTQDPYLVFATSTLSLLGLRALYFVLHSSLDSLRYLDHGLGLILAFIGAKLVLHWAHSRWPAVPEVPTPLSLGVIITTLAAVTAASLLANRRDDRKTDLANKVRKS